MGLGHGSILKTGTIVVPIFLINSCFFDEIQLLYKK